MKAINKAIRYIFYVLFLPVWHLERLFPRNKNIWIFGSREGKHYWDNSRALFEHVILRHPEIKAVWLTGNKVIYETLRSKNIAVFMTRSFMGILYSLLAKYHIYDFGPTDLNPYTKNGAKKICLWHGNPLKKISYYDVYEKNRIPFLIVKRIIVYFLCPYYRNDSNIDLLIVSSDFFKPFMSYSFANVFGRKLSEQKIITTGLPRNDKLFTNKNSPLLTEIREKYRDCRIVFYMPTYRLVKISNIPFSPFAGFGFDKLKFIDFLESENIIFLFKPHPDDANLPDFALAERFIYLKGNEYDDLYEFLGDIDILVTDYSSVYFDFILTNKPVILTPFDYDEYINNRGLLFDYDTYMLGAKAYNWNDFIDIVRERKYYAANNNDTFNCYKDADSCKRVFDAIKSMT